VPDTLGNVFQRLSVACYESIQIQHHLDCDTPLNLTMSLFTQVAKALYKEFITVQKNSETKQIELISKVIKASAWDGDICWFPGDEHTQTFCYLILNPVNRIVSVLSHDFGKGVW
jgi:hypothetical protein